MSEKDKMLFESREERRKMFAGKLSSVSYFVEMVSSVEHAYTSEGEAIRKKF